MTALDLQVLRSDMARDRFQAEGDPEDAAWLRQQLREWLKGHGWREPTWNRFEIVARKRGESAVISKVRAV